MSPVPFPPRLCAIACVLALACAGAARSQQAGGAMRHARGHFDIKMTPQDGAPDGIGRFGFTKTFRGDLQGTSTGAMLGVRTATPGSAGYVVIEHVSATLAGHTGDFMLQHFGIMDRGRLDTRIAIIPDSGREGLAGIAGTMSIDARAGHAYTLDYTLPPKP